MAGKKDIIKNALKVAGEYFAPDTPEYAKNLETFFGSTDPNIRRKLYTGTSKDKDFSAFQESRHGTWLTANPEEASEYAMQNDSQSLRMIPGTWNYEPVNSASRVIPAYARVENPYRGELPDFARVDNYKKAQSDWFDKLRAQGYDAWVPDSRKGEMVVVLKDQGNRVKSAIGNAGTFDLNKKHMNKAEGGSIREGYGPGGWVDDVVKMAGKVISGEGEEAAKTGIRAYQGSPHNFAAERLVRFPEGRTEYIVGQPDVLPDVPEGAEVLQDFPLGRMRMDKIGTGEGAQAYGHGLYLAEHEPVAQGYKDALRRKGDEITFDNMPLKEPRDYNAIQSQLENQEGDWRLFKAVDEITTRQGSMEDRLGDIRNWYRNQPEMLAAIDRAEKRMTLKENPGFVYETNISADPDAFLDWDKPLSEQPSLIRALGNYDPEYYVDYDEIIHKAMQSLQPVREPTGEDIYRALGHPKTATRMLNTMGVPGIRFLDAGSRVHDDTAIGMIKNYGSREKALEVAQKRLASAHHSDRASWQKTVDALSRPETRNLVVFDDKLISIIRKYGIAGASAMLGYNLMEQLDPKQALAASMADQDYQASRPQRSMGGNNSISGALNVARGLNGVK